jgi:hypothetical protein
MEELKSGHEKGDITPLEICRVWDSTSMAHGLEVTASERQPSRKEKDSPRKSSQNLSE